MLAQDGQVFGQDLFYGADGIDRGRPGPLAIAAPIAAGAHVSMASGTLTAFLTAR